MKKTSKANYVDGFVLPVPSKNLKAYKKMAAIGAKVWLDHGALEYVECVSDDIAPGKVTSFSQSVKLKKGEVVVFAWVTYKSKKHRDQVMKKVMADERLTGSFETMPFDGMRMFWGGFKPLIQKNA